MLTEPISQRPKIFGIGGKTRFLVFGSPIGIRYADAGEYLGFVNIQTTAGISMNLKHGIPSKKNWEEPH